MANGKAIYKLPVKDFTKAQDIFVKDNYENDMIINQYSRKRTKNEKIKYLRFMGYLETPEK